MKKFIELGNDVSRKFYYDYDEDAIFEEISDSDDVKLHITINNGKRYSILRVNGKRFQKSLSSIRESMEKTSSDDYDLEYLGPLVNNLTTNLNEESFKEAIDKLLDRRLITGNKYICRVSSEGHSLINNLNEYRSIQINHDIRMDDEDEYNQNMFYLVLYPVKITDNNERFIYGC